MSGNDRESQQLFTTNEEDKAEAAKLKARLASSASHSHASSHQVVPYVSIAKGAHKYVLIKAREPQSGNESYFVTSRRGAAYHRNAAEPLVFQLETNGYSRIEIVGGGRISLDEDAKKISIFGFSYSFGQGDHNLSKAVIHADARYKDYTIDVSNDGY